MVALAGRTPGDFTQLLEADSVIDPVRKLLQEGRRPSAQERMSLPSLSKALLRQWDRLVEREGVLHRRVCTLGSGPELFQLLLPECLMEEVLQGVHDDQGHQGVERTLQLLRNRCFWPNMAKDAERWCTQCQRCVLGKAVQPKVRTLWNSLQASQPNEIVAMDFTLMERASDV